MESSAKKVKKRISGTASDNLTQYIEQKKSKKKRRILTAKQNHQCGWLSVFSLQQ